MSDGELAFFQVLDHVVGGRYRIFCKVRLADLLECTAYSDSRTDLPFLDAVGHPVAVNPDRELRRIARDRGWPVLEFSGRAYPHARRRIPPAFVAVGAAGVAAIVAARSRGR